jgi:hypothetical protein
MHNTSAPVRRTRLLAAAVAGLSATFGLATTADADVASVIPADALVVIKTGSLEKVASDFTALATEWGLTELEPDLRDPIASFKEESGFEEGIDFAGEFAFYLPAGADFENQDEPPVVALVPITDFQAFLTNFNTAEQDGNVYIVTIEAPGMNGGGDPELMLEEDAGAEFGDAMQDEMGEDVVELEMEGELMMEGNGEQVFVVDYGDYAAISSARQFVGEKPAQTLQLAGATGEQFAEQDVTLYANFRELGPALNGLLEENDARGEIAKAIDEAFEDEEMPEMFRMFRPVADAAVEQGLKAFDTFMTEADAATVAVDLDPAAGIRSAIVAQFKPESYLATTFDKQFDVEGDALLKGLPEGRYLVYGGSNTNPQANLELWDDVAGPILDAIKQVEGGDELKALLTDGAEQLRKTLGATEFQRFGLMAPAGRPGQSALVQQVQLSGGDAEQLQASAREIAELTPRAMQMVQNMAAQEMGEEEAAEMAEMLPEVEFVEGEKDVAGVSFDAIRTTTPGNMQAQFVNNMIFGPGGQVTYLANVDGTLVSVAGLTDAQIEQVVESVRGGDAALAGSAGVEMVNQYLPENRTSVFYVDLGQAAKTGLEIAAGFNLLPPVEVQDGLPPFALAVAPAENAVHIVTIVPKDLVSAMIVTSLQVQQAAGGGGMEMQ